MNHELAKKLKEAGFPQGFKGAFDDDHGKYFCGESEELAKSVSISLEEYEEGTICDGEWEIYCKDPSLEELIKACGDEFMELYQVDPLDDQLLIESKIKGKWKASMYQRDTTVWRNTMFGGRTPEEAVAELYLALYGKEKDQSN